MPLRTIGAPQAIIDVGATGRTSAADLQTTQGTPAPTLARQQLASSYRPPAQGPIKIAFFDADSTLRVSLSGKVSANGPKDVALLPQVGAALKQLHDEGYLIAIVSNQMGVEMGHVSIEDADAALAFTVDLIRQAGGDVHWVDFAEKKGPRRKPEPGMADDLFAFLDKSFGRSVDKAASFMVGDSAYKKGEPMPVGGVGRDFSNSDRLFAASVGVEFHDPASFFDWRSIGVERFDDIAALTTWRDAQRGKAEALLGTETPHTAPATQTPSPSSALLVRAQLLVSAGD